MSKEKKISNEQLFEERRFDELYLNVIDLMRYKGNLYKKMDPVEKESIYNLSFAEVINRYDLSKDVKFSTFLCLVLAGNLNKYVSRDREYRNSHLRTSLDASLDDEDDNFKLLNCIESTTYDNPEEHSVCKEILDSIDEALDERMAKCLKLAIRDMKQEDIAKEMGISQVQVSRITKKARKILKEYLDGLREPYKKVVKTQEIETTMEAKKQASNISRRINRKKVGVKKMATKKEQCFELFEDGYHTNDIVKALAIPKNTVVAYKQMWQNNKKAVVNKEKVLTAAKPVVAEEMVSAPEVNTDTAISIGNKEVIDQIVAPNKVVSTINNIASSAEICTSIHKKSLVLVTDIKVYRGTDLIYKVTADKIIIGTQASSIELSKENFITFYEEINELKSLIGQ